MESFSTRRTAKRIRKGTIWLGWHCMFSLLVRTRGRPARRRTIPVEPIGCAWRPLCQAHAPVVAAGPCNAHTICPPHSHWAARNPFRVWEIYFLAEKDRLCLKPQLLVLTPTQTKPLHSQDTMAAALMSKSFAGASLRSAVPTKGQVRTLPLFSLPRLPTILHCHCIA